MASKSKIKFQSFIIKYVFVLLFLLFHISLTEPQSGIEFMTIISSPKCTRILEDLGLAGKETLTRKDFYIFMKTFALSGPIVKKLPKEEGEDTAHRMAEAALEGVPETFRFKDLEKYFSPDRIMEILSKKSGALHMAFMADLFDDGRKEEKEDKFESDPQFDDEFNQIYYKGKGEKYVRKDKATRMKEAEESIQKVFQKMAKESEESEKKMDDGL